MSLEEIVCKVQENTQCHLKYITILLKMYKKQNHDEMIEKLNTIIEKLFIQPPDAEKYLLKVFLFLGKFLAQIAVLEEENDSDYFFARCISGYLKHTTSKHFKIRYNSCRLLSIILKEVGDTPLENDLCDEIQAAMLERVKDIKNVIRLEALNVVQRLQDASNVKCPVIDAISNMCFDTNPQVRQEAVKVLAACPPTWAIIKEKVRDIDKGVRSIAFKRAAVIGPLPLKIIHRHEVLISGFLEINQSVKNNFMNILLPQWLTAYNGNFLTFIGALFLSVGEDDLLQFKRLTKDLVDFFCQKYPIKDIKKNLGINEAKLIDLQKLKIESSLLWNYLVAFLRASPENYSEYLEDTVPDLTEFVSFLDSFIMTISTNNMSELQIREHFILLNLLEIVEGYDLSDEVGRNSLLSLITSALTTHTFNPTLTSKMIDLADKCSYSTETFILNIIGLMSDIREPITQKPLTAEQILNRNFKISELRVQLNILKEEQDMAHEGRDYERAQILKNEVTKCLKEIEKLQNSSNYIGVKKRQNTVESNCRCLDILIGVLQLPTVTTLTPVLENFKNDFLEPLITEPLEETHWRVLKALALYSLLDKKLATEYANILVIPLVTYGRCINIDCLAVTQSITGVTDLMRKYGEDIFTKSNVDSDTSSVNSNKRTLHDTQTFSTQSETDMSVTLNRVLQILFQMLDSNSNQIKYTSVMAIHCLVLEFTITPSFASHLILKWFDPSIEKNDPRMCQSIGQILFHYKNRKDNRLVIRDAMLITFFEVVNAKRTSYLTGIEIEKLISFFANLMESDDKNEVTDLIKFILDKISEREDGILVPILIKFFAFLKISCLDSSSIKELIAEINLVQLQIEDKKLEKKIKDFQELLRKNCNTLDHIDTVEDIQKEDNIQIATRKCVVLLDKCKITEKAIQELHSSADDNSIISSPEKSPEVKQKRKRKQRI